MIKAVIFDMDEILRMKIKSEETVVIEDSVIGLEAAKKAGAYVIAFPTEYSETEYSERSDYSQAELIVKSLDKITP